MKAFAVILAMLSAVACAREAMPAPPAPRLKPECGVASYYHDALAGNPTASGEIFDPAHFTAAHNSHGFGAILRVTRRDDGRTVMVRINDRGPFIGGRIIDLSPAAADWLGLTGEGLADVCLHLVPPPGPGPGAFIPAP